MDSQIPDEILGEILQHGLSVSPVDQILTQSLFPGAPVKYPECTHSGKALPQPDLLLVCKRWLRVGSPLFYHSVRLANKPQVRKIASTFDTNPSLALMVCNLRLAGGYGQELEAVMKHLTRLNQLSISIFTDSGGYIGLTRGLTHVNPTYLYIIDITGLHKPPCKTIMQALCEAAPGWTNLVSPVSMYFTSYGR